MAKELPKVYDPKEVESRIYDDVGEPRLLPGPTRSGEKALHHRHAAPQCDRSAAHGPRHGRHPAGHPDPLQADAGLCRPVGARHGPCGHRHPDQGGGGAAREGGPDPLRSGPGEVPGAGLGRGRRSSATALSSSRRSWAPPATGSRARFTMDEGCSKAVREVFVSLYEKGLIYKGSRIINWCPHCVTALSDAEVEYQDKPGHLWHMRYPLADGSRLSGGGHHPAGDHDGRHRRGRQPQRRALSGPGGQDRASCP